MITVNELYLFEVLIRQGKIAPEDAIAIQTKAKEKGRGPIEELIHSGQTTEPELLAFMAEDTGYPTQEAILSADQVTLEAIPRDLLTRYHIFPLERTHHQLRLALSDPFDFEMLDTLQGLLHEKIVPVIVPRHAIRTALSHFLGDPSSETPQPTPALPSSPSPPNSSSTTAWHSTKEEAPLIQLVHQMIFEGYQRGASDIHWEPMENRFRVRYRIDGQLHTFSDPPQNLQASILSRLKIMAGMSIAEKRLPQDGRFQLRMKHPISLDVRVSSIPTLHGESIVMRLLDSSSLLLDFPELGFLQDDQATMEQILRYPNGMILATGPTGSGKTTTLYACLQRLNQSSRKIITVEDPIEYQLSGINQVPVNEQAGMTFAAALKSMLRQAPNILMVGEIRDRETASLAIHAALTGHLVFSTLHTNDAPSAISRLIDIGIPAFLIASSLRAILAQRLIRKNCPYCQTSHPLTSIEQAYFTNHGLSSSNLTWQRGQGCSHCRGTGYLGRMGVFEIALIEDPLRQLIHQNASAATLREEARCRGMRTLREDAWRKITHGLSTLEEILATTPP